MASNWWRGKKSRPGAPYAGLAYGGLTVLEILAPLTVNFPTLPYAYMVCNAVCWGGRDGDSDFSDVGGQRR